MRAEAVLDLVRRYRDEWLVLDRALTVLDRGPELAPLRARWSGRCATFLRSPR